MSSRSFSPYDLVEAVRELGQSIELSVGQFMEKLEPLVMAQIDNAIGIRHLMMRDPKTGKFERVTGSEDQIDAALKMGNAFWIYTKDPNVQAFTDLMNRALDKPAAQVQIEQNMNVHIHAEIRSKIQEALIREERLIESRTNKSS